MADERDARSAITLQLEISEPIHPDDVRHGGGSDPPSPDQRPIEFSDDALAAEFTTRYSDHLLSLPKAGRWLIWDGTRWAPDEKLVVFNLMRRVCRDVAQQAEKKTVAAAITSKTTIYAAVKLASTDPRHAIVPDDLDRDPWVLNTPDGILDLRTGEMGPHRKEARLSKITAAKFGGECPKWLKFLGEVTNGDEELMAYLQRVVGYCLTGSVREHAVFFLHGRGGNGKGVFVNVVSALLGEYARTAPMDLFVIAKGERHPTELALLAGARLVTASETEEGRAWDLARLKAITGGDTIAARFMRGDYFDFRPTAKLMLAGNHLPSIRTVDAGIRRRFHIVPFGRQIEQPDKDLESRLRAEWPGILSWALDGGLAYQKIGLATPEAVAQATDRYLEVEDAVGRWLEERTLKDPDAWASTKDLHSDFGSWAVVAGEYKRSERKLAQELEQRGFERERNWQNAGERGFRGLGLLSGSQVSLPIEAGKEKQPSEADGQQSDGSRDWEY